MISTEIQKVSKTKILVAPNDDKTRQLVIYSNYIDNISDLNAMILPVPLPDTVQFINLSNYKNLFEDCDECFYKPSRGNTYSMTLNMSYRTNNKSLEVFNVGNYQVSLAKNLEQINRVDSNIFKLSQGLKKTLEMFYYQP